MKIIQNILLAALTISIVSPIAAIPSLNKSAYATRPNFQHAPAKKVAVKQNNLAATDKTAATTPKTSIPTSGQTGQATGWSLKSKVLTTLGIAAGGVITLGVALILWRRARVRHFNFQRM